MKISRPNDGIFAIVQRQIKDLMPDDMIAIRMDDTSQTIPFQTVEEQQTLWCFNQTIIRVIDVTSVRSDDYTISKLNVTVSYNEIESKNLKPLAWKFLS